MQTKVYYKLFYSVSKEASHKPLKAAAASLKVFPSVFIINTTCFDECFLFYVITGNSIFYTNLLLPGGLVQPREVGIYVRYLHNNTTMMLIPKIQNKPTS